MLSDDGENVRRLAVNKILFVRGKLSGLEVHIRTRKGFSGGTFIVQYDDGEEEMKDDTVDKGVRKEGGLGLKPLLELDILQNFITCAKEINCFRILFAC